MASVLRFRVPADLAEDARKRLAQRGFPVPGNEGIMEYRGTKFRFSYKEEEGVLELELLENHTVWPDFVIKKKVRSAMKEEGIKEC